MLYVLGFLIAIGIIVYMETVNNPSTVDQVTIIEAAKNSDDPLVLEEAKKAKKELAEIQEKRAEKEADKAWRETNPKQYSAQQVEKEQSLIGLVLAGAGWCCSPGVVSSSTRLARYQPQKKPVEGSLGLTEIVSLDVVSVSYAHRVAKT